MQRERAAFGFVNAFKPPGLTSTRFGSWARTLYGGAPIGHWGTLDPAACGVLVLAVGWASRLLPYLSPTDKSYVFEFRPGATTDTADWTGRTLQTAAVPNAWADGLPAVLADLTGEIDQTVPMYSAVKMRGRPLYERARAGERDAGRPVRRVRIASLRLIDADGAAARLAVTCSAGTYVRTLCEQIGQRLGLPAHLGMLLRTAAGPFDFAGSVLPSDLARDPKARLVDPLAVLPLPRVALDDEQARRFSRGMPTSVPDRTSDGDVIALLDGAIAGLGRVEDGVLRPRRVLSREAGEGSMQAEAKV